MYRIVLYSCSFVIEGCTTSLYLETGFVDVHCVHFCVHLIFVELKRKCKYYLIVGMSGNIQNMKVAASITNIKVFHGPNTKINI